MNRKNDTLRLCQTCRKPFRTSSYPCFEKRGFGKFCSRQCSGNSCSKATDTQVITMFAQLRSCSEIAERLGCSSTVVARRLRRNGLSYGKSRNGQNNGMYGKTHTEEAIKKIIDANHRQFSNQEARDRHAALTCEQIRSGRTGKAYNNLETKVAYAFSTLGTKFVQQFRLGRFLYDFFLPDSNTLVEVHGTFWHADPRRYADRRLSPIQIRNVANDKRKAEYAEDHGYKLKIIWEADVESGVAIFT